MTTHRLRSRYTSSRLLRRPYVYIKRKHHMALVYVTNSRNFNTTIRAEGYRGVGCVGWLWVEKCSFSRGWKCVSWAHNLCWGKKAWNMPGKPLRARVCYRGVKNKRTGWSKCRRHEKTWMIYSKLLWRYVWPLMKQFSRLSKDVGFIETNRNVTSNEFTFIIKYSIIATI